METIAEAMNVHVRLLASMLLLALVGCSSQGEECHHLPDDVAVGNAGCLITRPGAVVMVQQRLGGGWALPGGTAEAGERAACTAARETKEETGLTVTVVEPLIVLDNGFHLYRCDVIGAPNFASQDVGEIQSVAWKIATERRDLTWRFKEQREIIEALIQRYE